MLAFLGPAQAVAISPFCTLEDVTAWSSVHSTTKEVLEADAVWRQLLITHFQSVFNCLGTLKEGSAAPERLAAQLCHKQELKEVYLALRKTASACPFVLEPRARLLLEIHELLEWDRHKRRFVEHQQASRLAEAFSDWEAVEKLQVALVPPALELVSLQTMMGNSRPVRLPQLEKIHWGETAEADLRKLMEKRLQQRRTWWQRQREYLLQGLDPP